MDDHKQKLDKEYENLLQQFAKELEKLQSRHHQELERKVTRNRMLSRNSKHKFTLVFLHQLKHNLASERKLSKQIQQQQEQDMKNFQQQQKKEYKLNCERVKRVGNLTLPLLLKQYLFIQASYLLFDIWF